MQGESEDDGLKDGGEKWTKGSVGSESFTVG